MSYFGKLNPFKIIVLGFAAMITAGTLLLHLPVSTVSGQWTPITDCIFTATSASCVTGLVVYDTGTYWSFFGQRVILVLIQIGGIGVITFAMLISILTGKAIGLNRRSIMQSSVSAANIGGILKLTHFIFAVTATCEGIGARLCLGPFVKVYGPLKGSWVRLFHSISAFCNAGFDIMGADLSRSLSAYRANPLINVTTMSLIIVGGLGFAVLNDIVKNRFNLSRISLQTKIVLAVSLTLIFVPAVFFYFAEFTSRRGTERVLVSVFQSVTTRTAGFSTVDVGSMSEPGQALMIPLMLVGGSPGSTAGGMKTTTLLCLLLCVRKKLSPGKGFSAFSRRVDDDVIHTAVSLAVIYLVLFFFGGMRIRLLERTALLSCLFESASALGTVGLTAGITPGLCARSKYILVILMFVGRTGGLNVLYATGSFRNISTATLPTEDLMVG